MSTVSLHKKLAKLPQPKNNFEISMPDDEEAESVLSEQVEGSEGTSAHIADQAEVDRAAAQARAAAADAAWAKRSHALQRGLPRPTAVNDSVLRSAAEEPGLTDLQKAEELIKEEMLTMLHYDSLHNPPPTLLNDLSRNAEGKLLSATAQQKKLQQLNANHEVFLRDNEYEEFDDEILSAVRLLLDYSECFLVINIIFLLRRNLSSTSSHFRILVKTNNLSIDIMVLFVRFNGTETDLNYPLYKSDSSYLQSLKFVITT